MFRSRGRLALVPLALVLTATFLGASPPAQAEETDACDTSVSVDFNGDADTDTVVADPDATVAGQAKAGRVVVLYGGNGTFEVGEGGGRHVISQNTSGVGDTAEAGDHFGRALTAADLDCDGYTDLVIGAPDEDLGGRTDSGLVQVIWGSVGGIGDDRSSTDYDQSDFNVVARKGDHFGAALAAVEDVQFDGTYAPDAYALGIGVPGWDVGSATDAGAAAFITPYDGSDVRNFVTQNSPNVPGAAEKGDHFGAALAMSAEYTYDQVKAVIGVPGEDVGSVVDAGSAALIDWFDDDGPGKTIALNQDSLGAAGSPEAGDRFGTAVAAVTDSQDRTRFAVGAPGEDVGAIKDAGAIDFFADFDDDLKSIASITQASAGVSGTAEVGDRFGEVLDTGDLFADHPTLTVGVPHEDGKAKDSGIVQIFDITDPASNDVTYSQDSPGVPGAAEADEHFGATVAKVGGEESVYLIGVPDDKTNSSGMVDVIPEAGLGDPRAWVPGIDGIPAAGAHRFGGALSVGQG